jgi:hypothetical protein
MLGELTIPDDLEICSLPENPKKSPWSYSPETGPGFKVIG